MGTRGRPHQCNRTEEWRHQHQQPNARRGRRRHRVQLSLARNYTLTDLCIFGPARINDEFIGTAGKSGTRYWRILRKKILEKVRKKIREKNFRVSVFGTLTIRENNFRATIIRENVFGKMHGNQADTSIKRTFSLVPWCPLLRGFTVHGFIQLADAGGTRHEFLLWLIKRIGIIETW